MGTVISMLVGALAALGMLCILALWYAGDTDPVLLVAYSLVAALGAIGGLGYHWSNGNKHE